MMLFRRYPANLMLWLLLLGVTGCVGVPTPAERHQTARELAVEHDLTPLHLPAERFYLLAMQTPAYSPGGEVAHIYLEGDGRSWASRWRVAKDPTPVDPIGLKLMVADKAPLRGWLGRPCQYQKPMVQGPRDRVCKQAYWSTHRYAPELVKAMGQGLDQLKQRLKVEKLVLIGYSGGGPMALLLANRRDDVLRVITVAANLDIAAWVRWHRVSPLVGLDPGMELDSLKRIPQIHLSGADDRVAPALLQQRFRARLPASAPITLQTIPKTDHTCCWPEQWPALLRSTIPQ
uniref:Alpha/beta hydrolase n=1 Tax=Magnetococcus massalia (strain MO-1) TaxID=451514 RepID=A0A1S7LG60_MAGMO|nr:conserved protein of unknown function [Candidatus Magnetococcus massalia]